MQAQGIPLGDKPCTRCDAVKCLTEFSPLPTMADGRHSHCKACQAAASREWRRQNRDRNREGERERGRERYARLRAENPEAHRARVARWRAENPEHNHLIATAHRAVRRALLRGELVRPDVCGECGGAGPIEAHHPDHREVLAVLWLCRTCHRSADGHGD